ncbi:MAG: energy-coupling factor transporter transmembrane protein EcfT [Clostridia bacterium]|nr:energy-coupling factor transporter transmembrane protein EcfT [Clostridia bacterium]
MKNPKWLILFSIVMILLINSVLNRVVLSGVLVILITFAIIRIFKSNLKSKMIFVILGMAAAFSMLQAFSIGSMIVYRFNIMSFDVNIHAEGLEKASRTFLRISCSMYIMLILTSILSLKGFLGVMKSLGLPAAFTEVLLWTVKFVYIFKEDIAVIRKAQKARLGYANGIRSACSIGTAAGMLLSNAFDRSEVLSKAIKARGGENYRAARTEEST